MPRVSFIWDDDFRQNDLIVDLSAICSKGKMGSKGHHCTLSPGLNIWYKLRQVSRGGFSGCMIGSEQRYVVDGSSLTLGGG